jgi:hypothetical protein
MRIFNSRTRTSELSMPTHRSRTCLSSLVQDRNSTKCIAESDLRWDVGIFIAAEPNKLALCYEDDKYQGLNV